MCPHSLSHDLMAYDALKTIALSAPQLVAVGALSEVNMPMTMH